MTEPLRYAKRATPRYDLTSGWLWSEDPVDSMTVTDLPALAASEDWEDRVRAEVLRQGLRITLPDGFPCIYETADSLSKARHADPQPFAWVVSPDMAVLEAAFEDYQALWDAYTDQWGPTARRTFAVGRLDGVSPAGVYLPGTTAEQIIGQTMVTHTGMYRYAPDRLKAMHPQHEAWQQQRAARVAR